MSVFRPYLSWPCYIVVLKLLLLSLQTEAANVNDNSDGYYIVSAAGTIFSGRSYGVVVALFETTVSCSCEVLLEGPGFNASIDMNLTPINPISWYRFDLPELLPGNYWLKVKSLRGMPFSNATKLTWYNFKSFIKIQTPKTTYRNGELVQFRVLFHNETLHPVSPDNNAIIWIEDAKGYHISLFKQLEVYKGVFESSLLLSRNPNLGRWHICVKNGRLATEECIQFQVKEDEFSNGEKVEFKSRARSSKNRRHSGDAKKKKKKKGDHSSTAKSNITIATRSRPALRKGNVIQLDFGTPVGQPEMIKFQLDHKLNYVICMIMCNGLVLASGQLYPDKTNTFTLEVQLSSKVWPFVHIYIYGMESNSDALYAATHMIEVERKKHEQLEIEVPNSVKPGEEISLRIKAVPDAYLGLLVVDNRTYRDDNDITDDYIESVKSRLKAASPNKKLNESATILNMDLVKMTNAKTISMLNLNIVNKTDSIKRTIKPRTNIIQAVTQKIPELTDNNVFQGSLLTVPFKRSAATNTTCCDYQSTEQKSDDVWIFDNIQNTLDGWTNWTTDAPNKIANWRLNAFVLDPDAGLTLLRPKAFINIKTTKSLYLQYTVPQRIKVGETLVLPVYCFNQLEKSINVTIRVKVNESNFELLDGKKAVTSLEYMEKQLFVKSNSSSALSIFVRPLKSGTLSLNISAISGTLSDTLVRQIEVLLPGQLLTHEMIAFRNLEWHQMSSKFQLKLPHNHTSDGVKCYLSGNLIAANIQSLKSITRRDNGEQMITKLMDIYHLWDYVHDNISLSEQYRQFLEDQLNDGFQSMMRMRLRDGSFTYDEPPRSNCSATWLTAYGLHTLNFLLTTPVQFDTRLLIQNENFLLSRRLNRTQFVEKCEILQRRKLDEYELTLDVLKVLQLSTRIIRIEESHSWMIQQLQNNTDYHLEAKRNHKIPDWIRPAEQTANNWTEYRRNIETSGRILTGQLTRKKVPQFELYEWLVLQVYGEPCKTDCFECFIAKQAIYNYIRSQKNEPLLELTVSAWGQLTDKREITVNLKNQWQAQQVQLQAENQILNFEASGLGELLVQCSYEYDLKQQKTTDQNQTQYYELRVTPTEASDSSELFFKFCVQRYKRDREFYIGTEIELHLPSGYVLSPSGVHRLLDYRKVLQASSEDGNTKMFMRLGVLNLNIFTCMAVLVRRLYEVENLQPGMMIASDTNSMHTPQVLDYDVTFK